MVSCTLVSNGYAVSKIKALPDTGANGYGFMDFRCFEDISRFMPLKRKELAHPIRAKGFDGKVAKPITHYIQVDLVIDGRRLARVPFCLLDLGSYDIILGSKWMSHFDVLPDIRRRKLVWPEHMPLSPSFAHLITVRRDALYPRKMNLEHQRDAEARDIGIAREERRRESGREGGRIMLLERQACVPTALGEPTKLNSEASQNFPVEDSLPRAMLTPRESYERSLAASYKRMSQELLGQIPASPPAAEQRTKKLEKKPFEALNICEISAEGMHLNMNRRENTFFVCTIDEIDKELENRGVLLASLDKATEAKELLQRLPSAYHNY